jgi:endonuclease/exonuclease/phosphatase family metal-dependent hydrolase
MRHGIKRELRIGKRNVLTVYKGGALKQLEKVLQDYKVDIIALQEIRWRFGEEELQCVLLLSQN